ncbi:MAG: hydantoinase/oxoprolinase family protein, partial [Planctomycetota bacterium]|nr:hydantoinase/oxoprolinase family protein [Planctomycetota bacterium]
MGERRQVTVGVDTGGTFTDAVAEGPEGLRVVKVPSTPEAPEGAVRAALAALSADGAAVRHGTTVGTNAVLTRTGARVVFVTTRGFEDLPWIGRGTRADLHALSPTRTPPLAAVAVGVAERASADGRVVLALSAAEVRRVVQRVRAQRPEAIAVCLLHAVSSAVHERRLGRALKALNVPVYLSSEACADGRELERGQTAVLDAYVGPRLQHYLAAVETAVGRGRLTITRSDGGRMTPAEVARVPARTLLSGPAAGVVAAQALAAAHGVPRVLSFDVGGTSTDVAWIEGEELDIGPSLQVGAHAASVPSVGIETVGAGGGSEVWLDAGGALRVGPQSAGARPGPACYGLGGPFALTDAWLLAGRIPAALLDGALPLDAAAANRAAGPLA